MISMDRDGLGVPAEETEDAMAAYERIMEAYRAGAYGQAVLSMRRILERAGEPDLFDRMSVAELRVLEGRASGITKMMFGALVQARMSMDVIGVPVRPEEEGAGYSAASADGGEEEPDPDGVS